MSTLKIKAERIKNEKNSKIIPENIKKGVTIFDITGNYEPESISGAKLFATKQDMENDTTAKSGDLALVYEDLTVKLKSTDRFDTVIFPDRVVLESQVTDFISPSFEIDGGDIFEGMIELDQNMFRFSLSDDYSKDVSYFSEDGLTYEKESGPDEINLGYYIYNTYGWDDRLGYFINIPSANFEGAYIYDRRQNKQYIVGIGNPVYTNELNYTKTDVYCPGFIHGMNECVFHNITQVSPKSSGITCGIVYNKITKHAFVFDECDELGYDTDLGKFVLLSESNSDRTVYEIDAMTGELLNVTTVSNPIDYESEYTSTYFKFYEVDNQNEILLGGFGNLVGYLINHIEKKTCPELSLKFDIYTSNKYVSKVEPSERGFSKMTVWHLITQDLTTTADDVWNSRFYGRDGIEDGTLLVNPDSRLLDYNAMLYNEMLDVYNDMTPIRPSASGVHSHLYAIPMKYDGTALIDTSGITDFKRIFQWNF